MLDERARQQLVAEPEPEPLPPPTYAYRGARAVRRPTPDPLVEERRRREYDSLFASNVVLSRRPDAQRLTTGASGSMRRGDRRRWRATSAPTIDEVADAVVRATSRLQPPAQYRVRTRGACGGPTGSGSHSNCIGDRAGPDLSPPDLSARWDHSIPCWKARSSTPS